MASFNPRDGVLMRRVALAAVIVATALAAMKAAAFALTDSMAMLGSLADSALDVFASFVNLLAVNQALTPADREHRFGHGKAEPLAGLAQGALIGGSAVFLAVESIRRLLAPHAIANGDVGIVVMVISIIATLLLVAAQRYVVRRTGSIAIRSDSAHYVTDTLVNAGVIVGILAASTFGWTAADPIVGLAISGIIAHTAWGVFVQSYDQLMDHELPEEDRARIRDILLAHSDIQGIHDLRTRAAGMQSFIQVHIELDPSMLLSRAHQISDEAEAQVRAAFPQAEIIIHQDPRGLERPAILAQS